MEARTIDIDGYESPGDLRLFVEIQGLLGASIPRLAGLATLTGMPASLDLLVGPFSFDSGDVTNFEVGYTGSESIGSLTVDAEIDTTTFGAIRGRAIISQAPRTLAISGEFGSQSNIHVANSDPIDVLSVQVTGLLMGNPASALVAFTNVPARIDLGLTGFGEDALGVPTLTYNGHGSSALDGLVQVEADLIEAFSLGGVTIPIAGDAYARFTNLGTDTTIQVNPDTSVQFSSSPDTDSIEVGAAIESSVPNIPINLQVFDELGFTGTLVGHVGAPTIQVGLELSISGLRSLSLSPSEVSYLTTGIQGDYDVLSIDAFDMFIDPDVELTLEVDGPLLLDFDISASIQEPFTGVRFHLADQVMRESGCVAVDVFGVGVGHVRFFTKPGKTATQVNHIDVFGVNGPQALNYIDPIPTPLGIDPALVSIAIDLLTVYVTNPFGDAEADYDPGFGGC
jgi:hypothetical protein